MIELTRRYQFSASHRLHSSRLTEEENRRLYGKCNNPHGHGHNYVLEVRVRGPVDAQSGCAGRLAVLDRLVRERVLEAFDHRNLNTQVEEFRGDLVPTTENLARVIRQRLSAAWPQAFPGGWPRLKKIRIAETERNIFELDGTDDQ